MPRTFPGIPVAQLLMPVPAFVDEAPVSADKRIFFTCAVAVLVVGGWTVPAEAQRGGRVRVIAPSRVVVVGGGFYDPFWYYDPWWGSPYQWGPYPYPAYPPYRYYRDPGASVRLEVKPKEAEVFVDGYYAGIVDDFDGAFQRLRVEPGEHEITLYLDGYRTVRQKVYLTPNNTFKIKYALERLAAGEQPEPRPQPPAVAQVPPQQTPGPQPPMYPPTGGVRRVPPSPRMPPTSPPPPPGSEPRATPGVPGVADGYGTLAIRVQPADAEVLIDGEVWHGPTDRDRMLVEVAEGRHSVEIRKAGYRTFVTDVQVRRGDTTPLNVSLRGQNEQ